MRIAWDNRIKEATLTATNENLNYPIENIIHNYLTKKFKGTRTESTITITFTDVEDINFIAIGYKNLIDAEAEFFDIDNISLGTQVLNCDIDINYFTKISAVKKINLAVTTDQDYVEIGNISAGEYLQLENPFVTIPITPSLSTKFSKSDGGQLTGRKLKSLLSYEFKFPPIIEISDIEDIKKMLDSVQTVENIWIDIWELNNNILSSKFGNIISAQFNLSKNQNYDFIFSFQESY